LTTSEALQLCDALADAGCEQCNVSGGEPLLRPDWRLLCERLVSRGVRVTLVTNGTLLDDEVAHAVREAGVSAVAVSLDGMRETHDRIRRWRARQGSSFRAVSEAIERVHKVGLVAAAITHVNQWNLGELGSVHALLRQLGLEYWQVQLGLPLGRMRQLHGYMLTPEQLPLLAAELVALRRAGGMPRLRVTDTIGYYTKLEPALRGGPGGRSVWTGCYAGVLTVGIDSNGDVKGCSSLPGAFVAGNVRDRPFAEIWADESRFAYNTEWHEGLLTGFCAGCAFRRLCRAGCTSLAWAVTGAIHDNPYCLYRLEAQARAAPGASTA
jgi:radical SAM protein with 4Fe4S-binding SPASM domain